MTTNRPLRVFLCHSSADKPAVRELYQKLRAEPWISPWLDEEELFPGMDWNMEIEKAVEAADAIIVCLSKGSITKEGYVQRELRIVLDYADYKPEGTLYLMPVRLEECDPPRRLRPWQYADYFEGQRDRALDRLLVSLRKRAESLNLDFEKPKLNINEVMDLLDQVDIESLNSEITIPDAVEIVEDSKRIILSNGMEFMLVPAGKFLMGSTKENLLAYQNERPQHTVNISYDYWMARFPTTNDLYNTYTKAKGIKHPVDGWERIKYHPIVSMKWVDAMNYCQWLTNLLKGEIPSGLTLRLPTEAEWEKAARGIDGREYPWGNEFDINKCNSSEGGKNNTTSIGSYSPQGDSLYGCADMVGNVWEWTHSLKKEYPYNASDNRENEESSGRRVLRGGSYFKSERFARCACRVGFVNLLYFGFRVCLAPPLPK